MYTLDLSPMSNKRLVSEVSTITGTIQCNSEAPRSGHSATRDLVAWQLIRTGTF